MRPQTAGRRRLSIAAGPARELAADPGDVGDVADVGDELGRWALSLMCGVAALVPCSCPVGPKA